MFQYNLTLSNPFDVGLSGLDLFGAHTVFGLTDLSIIAAPQDVGHDPSADWSFFPPLAGVVDELNYFALSQSADVHPGESVSGFFFRSVVDPRTLPPDGFVLFRDYDLIDATGHQIPEPSSLLLLSVGVMLLRRTSYCWRGTSQERTLTSL